MNIDQRRYPSYKILMLSIAAFFVMYNVTLIGREMLASGRLMIIFLFCWAILEKTNVFRHIRTRAWLLFLPVPAVVLQYALVRDFGQLSRFMYLAYFSFLGGCLLALLAKSPAVILRAILIATTIQALFLFFSFFVSEYRTWFDATVLTGSNYDASYLYRAPGFSSAGGASLSVIQAFGVFAGWLLLRENDVFPAIRGKATYLVLLGMTLSFLSCIIVGRTGILLSVFFFLLFLFSYGVRPQLLVFLLVCTFIVGGVLSQFLVNLLDSNFSIDFFQQWAFGFLSGDDNTVTTLASMPVPPLSIETFLGTGLQSITDAGNPSGHDSGLVQAYFSMGLFFAVILYCIYLYVLWHILDWLPFFYRMAVTFVIFSLDIKEPFLFKYSVMFILLALHFSFRQARALRTSATILQSHA